MTRTLNKLKVKQVDALGPGRHSDGGGLYLQRDEQGRSRWVFMWTPPGATKRRSMGLGSAGHEGVSLAGARKAAAQAREDIEGGLDPKAERDRRAIDNADDDLVDDVNEAAPAPGAAITFGMVADDYVKAQEAGWRNEKHRAQWAMTLKVYAKPLRDLPVADVDTDAVLGVLRPLWLTKPETASRLRGRIEQVLHAAKAKKLRSGENPALWRGHLDHLLPKRRKLTRGHHAALDYADLPAFMAQLRQCEAITARALEFLILTAARSGEVLGATWAEVDLKGRVWTVPAARIKAGREHRVPLSDRAVAILEAVKPLADASDDPAAAPVFPGPRGNHLSGMSMAMLLRRLKLDGITVHGFRSSFRDWAGEETSHPREVAEAALAHVVGDATERAYRRKDALERRRKLMTAWADYTMKVERLRRSKRAA